MMRQLKLYNTVKTDLKISKNFHDKNSKYHKNDMMSKMVKSKKIFIVSDQKLKWNRKVQSRLQSKTSKMWKNLNNMSKNNRVQRALGESAHSRGWSARNNPHHGTTRTFFTRTNYSYRSLVIKIYIYARKPLPKFF